MSLSLCLLSLSKNKKFSPPLIRHAYAEKARVIACMDGASRTKQSFKAECDINNIMARYQKTGVMDFTARNQPRYGDCTGLDFQLAMDTVANARSMFEQLPSKLRARFENDPAQFLEFVHDDKNLEEARELGLLRPEDKAAPAAKAGAPEAPLKAPEGPKDPVGATQPQRSGGGQHS